MDTLSLTKKIINKHNIKAKKSFGQNFLIDDNVLQEIVNISELDKNDLFIEIGPGLGNLTYYLQEYNLLLIELDYNMIDILNERFNNKNNINIISNDVLKIDIDKEIEKINKDNKINKVKVVANLPYYITTPIIFKLLESSKYISEIIVMIQEEVADRIIADTNSKDYGVLTLMIKYYGEASKEIKVPSNSFIPAPNVNSAVIKIIKEEKYNDIDVIKFKELVSKSFANRRKKLLNSLTNNNLFNLSKEQIKNILEECNINENARAEELSIEKYIEIIKKLTI